MSRSGYCDDLDPWATPEERWTRMYGWVCQNILEDVGEA